MRKSYFILILLCFNFCLLGQAVKQEGDNIFQQARYYAFEENDYEKAIQLILPTLKAYPNDSELKLFLCRMYFWASQHDNAINEITNYLDKWPKDFSAHKLHIDIYESQGRYNTSSEKISEALVYFPDDKELLYRLAYNYSQAKQYSKAKEITESLLLLEPNNKKVAGLSDMLKQKMSKSFVFSEYRHFFLSNKTQKLEYLNLQYGRKYSNSTLGFMLSSGRSFADKGIQIGVDGYQKLTKKTYSYLQLAYSKSELFPDLRATAALYISMDHNIESSIYVSLFSVNSQNTRVISPSLSKTILHSSFTATMNIINRAYENELTYRLRFRQNILGPGTFVGLAYGSFSRDETIGGSEQELTSNYISYEAQATIKQLIIIGLNYNRNITKNIKSRDQLSIYAKHNF